ncbi:uncharacterized protein LOC119741801 [Patiria miniata]|uniref:G-protein coupled receptors family 2 profile 2 domain-containing protein n=1 Tax=Patiria miniata TaxID=46514 RepID=A0A914BDW6_PATMI|nr:uncharacterized protein LOC119741801 [Patiria miniata]
MEFALSSCRIVLFLMTVVALIGVANGIRQTDAINVTLFWLKVRITPDASCCGRCNEAIPHNQTYEMTCYCDEYCLVYQDCCLDYELYCTDLEGRLSQEWADDGLLETVKNCSKDLVTLRKAGMASSNGSETVRDLCTAWQSEHAQSFIDEYSCKLEALWEPVILARKSNRSLVHVPGHSYSEFVLVQDCLKGRHTTDTYDLCMNTSVSSGFDTLNDVKKLVPVAGQDGLHYRNVYCARCNGMEDEDLQFWQVKLNCPFEVRRVGLTDSSVGRCTFESVGPPESFKGRISQPRLVPSEEISFSCGIFFTVQSKREYEEACRAYRLRTSCAKNPHCDGSCSCYRGSDEMKAPLFVPVSALFDFTTHRDMRYSLDGDPTVVVCEHEYEFFDPELGACRRFHCLPGQAYGPHGSCVAVDTASDRCLVSNLDDPRLVSFQVDFHTLVKYISSAELFLRNMTQTLLNVTITEFDLYDCQVPPFIDDANMHIPCNLSFTALPPLSFEETLSDFSTLIMSDPVLSGAGIFLKTLSLRNFDQQGSLVDRCGRLGQVPISYSLGVDYERFELNGSLFVVITVDIDDKITCPSDGLYQEVVFRPLEIQKRSEEFVYLCQMKLNCSMMILNSTEYTWLDNTTIRLSSGVNLSSDGYIQLSDDQVVVCRLGECLDCAEPSFLGDAVFSLVCLSISQLFLFLCLLSFCLFPELWTLPGKNLFCSILALFLTQTVFLIGPGSPLSQHTVSNEDSCLAFAVLVHYLLLAFFFWTNVVSLHFARTFGFKLQMQTRRFRRAFMWYSVYGWGAPAIISGAWVVVHRLLLTGRDTLVIYRHCLPYGVGALLLVATPISILMMANAVLFILTVVGIRRTRKSTSMVMKDKRKLERLKMEVALCIKILVATGMTWILIFIFGYAYVDGFSYLFSILISVQGPLLFFCFAFTERVRGMWRIRISGLWTRRSRAGASAGAGASAMSTARTSFQVADQ